MERILLILRVALRNIALYRFRTSIIATLLGFGAFLAVIGLSLLFDIQRTMRSSITESVAGDLQVYSKNAKDDLAIFGSMTMGRTDIGTIQDLAGVRDVILQHPNVEAFVPMGGDMALLGRGNEMDEAVDSLRVALKKGEAELLASRKDALYVHLEQLRNELVERRKILADKGELDRQSADVEKALSPEFLGTLDQIDEERLQFLETKVAPLSGEKQPLYLMYLGTDMEQFTRNFPKLKIVEGQPLAPGHRGILISNKVREDQMKNLAARLFDRIAKRITKRGSKIAGDAENTREAADLGRQYSQVISHLDRAEGAAVSSKLSEFGIPPPTGTNSPVAALTAQVKEFLTVNDANFMNRYKWFKENIAPKIKLYEIYPGETITLRSYTRSGYVKSLPLKVQGIYSFDGLEDSDLAGALNIIDLVSFRELYGQMTDQSRRELEEMRKEVGVAEISQETAEDALFGETAVPTKSATANPTVPKASVADTGKLAVKPSLPETFDIQEVKSGLALNAAIKLKNIDLMAKTKTDLEDTLKASGFEMQLVDWQTGSGVIGQFANIVGIALVFALCVIFLVALVIINNSIIVGTLNRTREIGTMRAIGAQRSFVMSLFLAESALTGLIGAVFGTVAALGVLLFLKSSGIASVNDMTTFLFSGPRLYPSLHWTLVFWSPLLVTAIATLASLFAARHAAKIQPADAMQEKE